MVPPDRLSPSGFESDHNPVGSQAAFFKDNISRHVIIGRNIECVLENTV